MPAEVAPHLSGSVEDYLKAIYSLTEEGAPATTGRIAERLSVAPASVTGMLKKLEKTAPPFVTRKARATVHLTEEGQRAALRTLRRHRLLEQFLLEVLHYSWDEVHDEAERLEHVVSPLFTERLSLLLGAPEFDPHGDPIPDANLNLPKLRLRKLADLSDGEAAVVRRFRNSEPDVLRYLAEVGFRPGVRVTMDSVNAPAGTIRVRVSGLDVTLGVDLGGSIMVEPRGDANGS